MARGLSVAVAAGGLLAAAGLLATGRPAATVGGGKGADLGRVAADLDGKLREVTAGVHARAMTLAELPRLQAAVSTDAATVRDLTQDELAFRPKPGEVIEIAQILKANPGKPERLWKSSDGETPQPPLDRFGPHLTVAGGSLYVSDVVEVKPRDRQAELSGAIALSWPVDVKPIISGFDAAAVAARLDVDGRHLPLGGGTLPEGAATTTLPLTSEAARGAQLLAAVSAAPAPSGGGMAGTAGAGAIAIVSLFAAALLWRRESRVSTEKAGSERAAAPPQGTSPVAAAGGAASSSAVDPVGKTGIAMPVPGGALSGVGAPSSDPAAAPANIPVTATAPRLSASGQPEQLVGRYSVIRPLGSGGMADVFLARSLGEAGFERLVAVKVLEKRLAQQPTIVEHFLDEARLASHLTHPNIVQISDLGRAGNEYYIAMEYVDGSDLERLLAAARAREARVPVKVAFNIVRKICDGLHAAHTATGSDGKPLELVHRDVKCANVFVARSGAVKIGDFGIAKANPAYRIHKTQVGTVKGTAAYMAPEHRMGEAVDARADLYSVGAIAYEVFTGNEINLDLVRIAHLGREGWPHLPPPSQVRPDLPAELDAVIFRALAYDKKDRQASCEALEAELEEIVNRHGLGASEKAVAQWVAEELSAAGSAAPASQSSVTRDRLGS